MSSRFGALPGLSLGACLLVCACERAPTDSLEILPTIQVAVVPPALRAMQPDAKVEHQAHLCGHDYLWVTYPTGANTTLELWRSGDDKTTYAKVDAWTLASPCPGSSDRELWFSAWVPHGSQCPHDAKAPYFTFELPQRCKGGPATSAIPFVVHATTGTHTGSTYKELQALAKDSREGQHIEASAQGFRTRYP